MGHNWSEPECAAADGKTVTDELTKLVRLALDRQALLAPGDIAAERREQRISWVYGEHCLRHDPPTMTREEVARIVDENEARKES